MKYCNKKVSILLWATLAVSTAWADHKLDNDPIGQLLQSQANASVSSKTALPLTLAVQTSITANQNEPDDLDVFLQNNISANTHTISLEPTDPIASLIQSEKLLYSDSKRQMVVDAAFNYLNIPYKYGGNTAATGFDCSGLVRAIYLDITNTSLPRTAAQQAINTIKISRSQLQPGDLVFFKTIKHRAFSHVGIYVGNNKFIHAPRTGAQVRIEDINTRYWNSRFTGARRVNIK